MAKRFWKYAVPTVPDLDVSPGMVITSGVGGSIVMLNVLVDEPLWSCTFTVNVLVSSCVGVPEMSVDWTPYDSNMVSPLGSEPETRLNLSGLPRPPLEVIKAE